MRADEIIVVGGTLNGQRVMSDPLSANEAIHRYYAMKAQGYLLLTMTDAESGEDYNVGGICPPFQRVSTSPPPSREMWSRRASARVVSLPENFTRAVSSRSISAFRGSPIRHAWPWRDGSAASPREPRQSKRARSAEGISSNSRAPILPIFPESPIIRQRSVAAI
jgi:hypothetical protein